MRYTIVLIYNVVTNKGYVTFTTKKPSSYLMDLKARARHPGERDLSMEIIRSVRECEELFKIEVLETLFDYTDANEVRKVAAAWVVDLNTLHPGGYNHLVRKGVVSQALRENASQRLIDRPFTAEHRARISAAQTGKPNLKVAKLTPEQVHRIRLALDEGQLPERLAEEYGVGTSNIKAIRDGYTWRHLKSVDIDDMI